MADLTTIKVSKPLRERISAAAGQEDATVQKFLEQLMDEHDRHKRMAAVAEAIRGADEPALSVWRAETAEWAAVDIDTEATR
ncbi:MULTISPECIES: hypothetical protein [Mycolicibacterium]|jgi:hypothetical protein|uniref:Uncharacterized protein n=1 Tax=Mycolicibacterium gilvum TaxID=1804 RepID=A0A379MMI2_9MYCO|nr:MULTISPECIES: hypothetical protein [Mycolicibacterium]MBU8813370.1 hypothetical protein [Mycolicibacterium goodii]MCV7059299.1 hypothetical protein [Mycolicibacterium gilvum]SUE32733.1 Uncharacterised protein [Mycolicibacterium gilvum]